MRRLVCWFKGRHDWVVTFTDLTDLGGEYIVVGLLCRICHEAVE